MIGVGSSSCNSFVLEESSSFATTLSTDANAYRRLNLFRKVSGFMWYGLNLAFKYKPSVHCSKSGFILKQEHLLANKKHRHLETSFVKVLS